MARIILIDTNSGYIWGDSADYAADRHANLYPELAAELLDDHLREPRHHYVSCGGRNPACAYHVYVAPNGFREITDGQDKAQIEAVEAECEFAGGLTRTREETFDEAYPQGERG